MAIGHEGDERPVVHDLLNRLQQTDVFYDIGAHTGLYTGIVASVIPADQVVAFEPYDEYAAEIEGCLGGLGHGVKVVKAGIGPTGTEYSYDPSTNAVRPDGSSNADPGQNASVREVNADALIDGGDLPQPTVVKIDVAGAEHKVLQGLERALSRPTCRLVYIEIHPPARHRPSVEDFGGSISEIHQFLLDQGYSIEILPTTRPSEYFVRAERT